MIKRPGPSKTIIVSKLLIFIRSCSIFITKIRRPCGKQFYLCGVSPEMCAFAGIDDPLVEAKLGSMPPMGVSVCVNFFPCKNIAGLVKGQA